MQVRAVLRRGSHVSGEPASVATQLHAFDEEGYSGVTVCLSPIEGHERGRLAQAVAIMRG
jgi:hypothetical protein